MLEKAGIVTLLAKTTLARVTYKKYFTRTLDEVAYGNYERFIFPLKLAPPASM